MFFVNQIRCIITNRLVISHRFSPPQHPYQSRIALWMQECFGGNHRANSGADAGFAHRTETTGTSHQGRAQTKTHTKKAHRVGYC